VRRWPKSFSLLVAALPLAAACGGSDSSRPLPPLNRAERAARTYHSAGDELLVFAPKGAQLVVEVDLRRLRENTVIGGLVRAASAVPGVGAPTFDAVRDADAFVLCAYELGTATAQTLTIVRSDELAKVAKRGRLADGVVAVGNEKMLERASETRKELSMASDLAFLETRDRAVPDKAPGAALRVTAQFDFDARVSMSRLLDLSSVPTWVSIWGDVVDDLAIVAQLGAENSKEARELGKASKAWLERMTGHELVKELVVGYLAHDVQVRVLSRAAALVLVIEPRRLKLLTRRLERLAKSRSEGQRSGSI